MDDNSDDERRRLLAALYGRDGAGLGPAQEQRLAELTRRTHATPVANDRPGDGLLGTEHTAEALPRPAAAPASRLPRRLVAVFTVAAVAVAALSAGWVGHSLLSALDADESRIPVDEPVAATLDAARGEVANEADPDTLVYIGMLNGGVVWEARSVDRETRCFVIAAIPDASQPAGADLLSCAPEAVGAVELWATSASGQSYTARGTIQAVWGGGRPAQLEPAWQDVTVTPLDSATIIERTQAVARGDEDARATPVAVSGLTALWAVERDGLRCISAITLSGSDVNTAGTENAYSCRTVEETEDRPIWIFPGPDFSFPEAPSSPTVRTVITWFPDQDPVATLRQD